MKVEERVVLLITLTIFALMLWIVRPRAAENLNAILEYYKEGNSTWSNSNNVLH